MLSITKVRSRSGQRVPSKRAELEVLYELGEAVELDEALRWRGLRKVVMLEHPGVGMMHVHGVKPRGECGIYVGPRAVADHPCGLG